MYVIKLLCIDKLYLRSVIFIMLLFALDSDIFYIIIITNFYIFNFVVHFYNTSILIYKVLFKLVFEIFTYNSTC